MLANFQLPAFYGHQDGSEDPEDFLKDLYFATKSETTDQDQARRVLFRSNLHGMARSWYGYLPREVRNDWVRTREAFLAKYRVNDNEAADQAFEIAQEITSLRQKPGESVHQYLARCDDIETRGGGVLVPSFGIHMVQGLTDNDQKRWVRYDLNKSKDYSYCNARNLLWARTKMTATFIDPKWR
ncbi:hypothetical protein BDV11DRAFT_172666 [Aspergillus similis]